MYRLSGEKRNRVPRTTPDAPRVRTDARWPPWTRPPAAKIGGEFRGATESVSERSVRREEAVLRPWPPASMPREIFYKYNGFFLKGMGREYLGQRRHQLSKCLSLPELPRLS